MTATRPRRAALYHRVSTSDQDPLAPLAELERAARSDGFTELEAVTETGSGALNDRPGLVRVMRAVRARKLSAVYVWKLDRFGRSALDLLSQLDELERRGCRFVAVSQGLEFGRRSDPVGRMMLVMLAAVAEFERELIRERTVLGLERARKRGAKLGRPRVSLPTGRPIAQMRARGWTWEQIQAETGLSPYLAKKAIAVDNRQRYRR